MRSATAHFATQGEVGARGGRGGAGEEGDSRLSYLNMRRRRENITRVGNISKCDRVVNFFNLNECFMQMAEHSG